MQLLIAPICYFVVLHLLLSYLLSYHHSYYIFHPKHQQHRGVGYKPAKQLTKALHGFYLNKQHEILIVFFSLYEVCQVKAEIFEGTRTS